jgi:hypothetical protein
MKIRITFYFVFCLCLVANGQMNSDKNIIKKVKLNLLEKVIQYQINSVVESDQIDDFTKLFKNNQFEILNDIIPDNALDKKISVEDYIDRVPSFFKDSRTIVVSPYEIKINSYSEGNGTAIVNCFKIISGKEKTGPYFLDTLDIGIIFEFKFNANEYKIIDIVLNQDPYFYLVIKSYENSIIGKRVISNDTMFINGKNYLSDKNGDIVIRYQNNFKRNFVIYPKSDQIIGIEVIQNIELKKSQIQNSRSHKLNLFKLNYRQSMVSVNPFFNFVGLNNSPINCSELKSRNGFSYEIGLNLLFSIYKGKYGEWLIKSGIGIGEYSYMVENPELNYSYIEVDPDKSVYMRFCRITKINESNKVSSLIVPVLIEKTHLIIPNYSLFLNLGVSYYKVNNANFSSNAIGNYYGQYPDLFDVTISDNGVYDFGRYELNSIGSLPLYNNFWVFQIGFGLNRNLTKRVGIRTGLSYKRSFDPINKVINKPISKSNAELNSLTSTNLPFIVNLLSLDLGLKYKL